MVSHRETVNSIPQRLAWRHRYVPGSKKGAIVMPGATQDRDWWFGLDDSTRELRDITDRDIPVACMGTLNTWGNSAVRTSMSTLKTNAQASIFASGKVHLVGVSAGGLSVLNWAKNNPTLVQSITLLIPVLDVQAVRTEDRNGFASVITTAYGGAPPDADNPADYAADLSGLPIRCYYSTSDPVTLEAETLAFCTASGAEAVSMGAQGHFWAAPWSGINVGNFIREND